MTQVPASSHGGGTFNGGTITNPLVIDLSADLVDRTGFTLLEPAAWGYTLAPFDIEVGGLTSLTQRTNGKIASGGNGISTEGANFDTKGGNFYATTAGSVIKVTVGPLGIATQVIDSGALPTVAPVSTMPFQCSTDRDVFLCIPFTGDATNNAATLKIELSPDGMTYSTLDTLSIAAALNLTGAINVPVTIAVPVGWSVKLTATHGTIGTSTYY